MRWSDSLVLPAEKGAENMKKRVIAGSILLTVLLLSILIFGLCGKYDNKYTAPEYTAKLGAAWMEPEQLKSSPVYLTDGWAYHEGKLLQPDVINSETPDDYVYIGQYSGFDRGEPAKSPYGQATYRLTLFVDSVTRDYALEIPQIYSDYRLWVNGDLKAETGSHGWMTTFAARDKIEIVLSVSVQSGLYSGLTYPPAFGAPPAVEKTLAGRLGLHTAAGAIALLIFVLCMFIGIGSRFSRPYHLLAALCLCFCACTAYPLIQALGWAHPIHSVAERLGYYGIFLLAALIQAKLCGIRKSAAAPIAVLGIIVLLSILFQPFVRVQNAGTKYIYSDFLTLYKWLTAAWLIGVSVWAVRRGKAYSLPLAAGFCVLAAALITDRLVPLYEPILLGWPVELAGFIFMLLVTGILWCDAVNAFRESVRLRTEKDALEEAGKMKSEFLNNLSHELQMPLTVVSGYAQLTDDRLSSGNFDSGDLADNQKHIILEADKMERMVLQLLDVAKMERGSFSLSIADVSLSDLVQEFADGYFSMLDENGNRLEVLTDEVLPLVSCDTERIVQVLINLVSNACRHTKHGVITISVHRIEENVEISVSDTGEGIPDTIKPYLFTQFLSGAQGKAAGTGLGLYICKKTVEAHGGTIWVESECGEGTTVRFSIPIRIQPAGSKGGQTYGTSISG